MYFDRSATQSPAKRGGSGGMHRPSSPHRENWAAWVYHRLLTAPGASERARFAEAMPFPGADHQVIEYRDSHDRSGFLKAPGELTVRFRGLGISRGVIVEEDQRYRLIGRGKPE